MDFAYAAQKGPVRLGPVTAGVVQRIELSAKPLPHLTVIKPMAECSCKINQY